MLVIHLKKVIDAEQEVNKAENARKIDGEESAKVDPSEIVSIHFAQKNFQKYRILLKIEDLTK